LEEIMMKCRCLIPVAVAILVIGVSCQQLNDKQVEEPTHVLQLLVGEPQQVVEGAATLFVQGGIAQIRVVLPDGDTLTTSYAVNDSNQIRFQLSRIEEGKLVVIQFVGTGETANGHEGVFSALVEGKPRPDMSGRFILKEREKK
jgi:hypothetical protein